jgi:hypothetical protein
MQNLVTYTKHFISKTSKHSYWHAILDDYGQLYVTHMDKMENVCKIRIKGMKEGYDKTLLLISYKGVRDSIFG